tara:strand:+ start:284 stop:949 length:666 start_codon:yes stop_codon:yes gene_type:complete
MSNYAKNLAERARIARESKQLARAGKGTVRGCPQCWESTFVIIEAMTATDTLFMWAENGQDDEGNSFDFGLALDASQDDIETKKAYRGSQEHNWVWARCFGYNKHWVEGVNVPSKQEKVAFLATLADEVKDIMEREAQTGSTGESACDPVDQATRAEGGVNWQDHLVPDVTDADRTDHAEAKRNKLSAAGQVVAQAVSESRQPSSRKREVVILKRLKRNAS